MEFVHEIFGSPWWFYAQSIFTLAMLIHAFRNGAETYWYFLVFLLQPFGAWAYFFLVFVRNIQFGRSGTGPLWQRKLSLNELRYHAERMPTVNNRLAYAQGLM